MAPPKRDKDRGGVEDQAWERTEEAATVETSAGQSGAGEKLQDRLGDISYRQSKNLKRVFGQSGGRSVQGQWCAWLSPGELMSSKAPACLRGEGALWGAQPVRGVQQSLNGLLVSASVTDHP
uniref:Uncharacterized protein n=1 Tax=Knipowitschia caucasica TaxID=637954 RepID=A0AAV2J5P9_KNICA